MARIQKVSLGVRFAERLFRVGSLSGMIADAVVSARAKPPLDAEYFTEVGRFNQGNLTRLMNEKRGQYLTVDLENMVFTQDFYESEKVFSWDEFIPAFRAIWQAVDPVLQVQGVRRIGFVAEYRFPRKDASGTLLRTLTKLKPQGIAQHKFQLTFETRRGTALGGLPDPKSKDFVNHIRTIYDSEADADHPMANHVNANLDVQRYYDPHLTKNIPDECIALRREYEKAEGPFLNELLELGVWDGEPHREAAA